MNKWSNLSKFSRRQQDISITFTILLQNSCDNFIFTMKIVKELQVEKQNKQCKYALLSNQNMQNLSTI